MPKQNKKSDPDEASITISIDAMSGDHGSAPIFTGIARFIRDHHNVRFLLHGNPVALALGLQKYQTVARVSEIIPAYKVIEMNARPSIAMRNSHGTSMASALDSVRNGKAKVCISCGNTGALMAVSMLKLRKIPGVNRPAIACLWPSLNPQGHNILLDVGSDITATAEDLLRFALMGTAYAKSGMRLTRPRLGLLNVGIEDHKGPAVLHKASALLEAASTPSTFDYVGFVEGNDIPSERVDVVITDGFTGNVALKSAEGTARLIRKLLGEAFRKNLFSKAIALLAYTALGSFSKRIDPRRVNGAVFLGLNGSVIKSHGSADEKGIEAAIRLATRLEKIDFSADLSEPSIKRNMPSLLANTAERKTDT